MNDHQESEHEHGRTEKDSLWFPASVLGAVIWGAVNFTLSAYGIINAKRDQIMDLIAKCGTCPNMILGPIELYFSNLLPLSVGMCLVFIILIYVLWKMPSFTTVSKHEMEKMKRIRWLFAALPCYCLVAFATGAVFDGYTLFTHL